MRALVFLAHGSRREKSNREVVELVDAIRPSLAPAFSSVDAAFLELAPPSLPEAIDRALEQGAQSVTVYPYFLNSGKHVEKDIPDVVDVYRSRYPGREFVVMRHFGSADAVRDMIVGQLKTGSD